MSSATICNRCGRSYWGEYLNHHIDYHMTKIMESLYLGGKASASSPYELKNNKINCVINLAKEIKNPNSTVIKYYHYKWMDIPEQSIYDDLKDIAQQINQHLTKGHRILIHCQKGKSRSATAICAYLIYIHKMTPSQAIKLLQKKRPIVNPNGGFRSQLVTFYNYVSLLNNTQNIVKRAAEILTLERIVTAK